MTSRRGSRRLALAGATVAALFLLPGVALAHAELVRPIPADGSTVTEPVTFVSGRYSEDLTGDSSLRVLEASGTTVATGTVDPSNDRAMIARPATPLTDGTYTVRSTTISAHDGDLDRATWTFTVAIPASPSPTPSPSESTAPPSAEPSPTASPTIAPSPSPSPGTPASGTADVLIPIVAALAIVTIGAGYLLSRGRRP